MKLFSILHKYAHFDNLTTEVFKKSFAAIFVKIFGLIFSFLVSIIIGRLFGADGLGVINLSNKIISIFTMISLFGVNQIIVREIAKAHKEKDTIKINSIINSSLRISGMLSLICSFLLLIFSDWISIEIFKDGRISFILKIFACSIPFLVMAKVYASGAMGFNKIWQGNLVNQVLTMIIILIILFVHFILSIEITLTSIVYSYLMARISLFLFFSSYWNFKLKPQDDNIYFEYKNLFLSSLPLLLASATVIFSESISTMLLGYFLDTKEIGFFSVALKLAMFTSFVLQVTNSAISPKIAQLYNSENLYSLNRVIKKTNVVCFIIGFFFFITFVFVGSNILSLWGDEFRKAYKLLIILAFGELFNVATGSTGVILVMTGYQKVRRNIAFISLSVNISLSYLFIYLFGTTGAALALCSTVISENLIKIYFVHKKTNIKIF